jgi:glycosyltransferase involved in cell wall biosynthesis
MNRESNPLVSSLEAPPSDRGEGGRISCLLVSPTDPLTRRPRAGALRRLLHPPSGVDYTLAADKVPFPGGAGYYGFTPVNAGIQAVRFALEHLFPLDQKGKTLVHSFFWDVRKFVVPWVHESDQSFGQFLTGYNNVRGVVRRLATEEFASFLNWDRCIGVIAWSEWAKRGFVEDGVDAAKVSVVPPPFGVKIDRRPHEGCNVLFLGRDYRRKGGETALRAFRALPGSADCRLIYVGRMEDPDELKALERDPRITHLERPSNRTLVDEVWPVIDVFILPTRADAFAITVVEAMRRGIPVVSTAVPAIREVVADGVSGILVRAGDEEGFCNSLRKLVEDPRLRKSIGENAMKRVEETFSVEKVNGALMEVYERAL